MIKFEIIKNVESNEENGGFIWVKVNINSIEKLLEYSFDFGDSLCDVCIINNEGEYVEELESVFNEEVVEELWNLNIV